MIAAAEELLVAGGVGPGDVEMRGSDAPEEIEHRPRLGISSACAVLSHAPAAWRYLAA
jgi:hypothetical protein